MSEQINAVESFASIDSVDARRHEQTTREVFALAIAAATSVYSLCIIPSWDSVALLSDPCHIAILASGATVLLLIATRSLKRGIGIERPVLALFLAAMPVIYVARGWLFGGTDSQLWPYLEGAGTIAFWALAWLGLRRSPWFLALGIPAHGLFWDAWHFHSAYIPLWYARGCFAVDVGLGLYVAIRLRAWAAGHCAKP